MKPKYTPHEHRLLALLERIGDAACIDVDTEDDPVCPWSEWDELSPDLEAKGYIVIEDNRIRVTWAGEKALSAWQKSHKYRRVF